MKTKILVLIAAMMVLFACKKADTVRELPGDSGTKIELPGDPELVNHAKDEQARLFKKGGNPNNPHTPNGGGGGGNPPPVVPHKACWLLDFDGYNVSNEVWGAINCSGSDFTSTEIADIVSRIKSYWSQFDVEITTDEALYATYSTYKRMRVVYTRTNFYGYVGGVAYIGSLNWLDEEKQCFVFPDMLSRNTKYNADAGAHEMGHTANCWHHVELQTNEAGCYVSSPYLVSNHLMGNSYSFSNPIFTTGPSDCGTETNDILNINTSIQ